MGTETFDPDATYMQLLASNLTLEEAEDAVLLKLKKCGHAYIRLRTDSTPEQQIIFSELMTVVYNLWRVFEIDRKIYARFDYNFGLREPEDQTATAQEFLEAVLLYALPSNSERWYKHATKVAAILALLLATGLPSDQLLFRLELLVSD